MTSAVGSGKYDIKGYDLYDSKEYQVVCICACSFDIIPIDKKKKLMFRI